MLNARQTGTGHLIAKAVMLSVGYNMQRDSHSMWKGVYKAKNKLLNTYLLVKQIAVKGYGNRSLEERTSASSCIFWRGVNHHVGFL